MYIEKNNNIEILAPVGKMDMLYPAIRRGANAVYMGIGKLNARSSAENFTDEEVFQVVEYAHSHGAKVYITLNVEFFQNETSDVINIIKTAAKAKADALIVQDLGVLKIAQEIAPTLPLHASTQMSINSLKGAQMAKELGFKRVVLAREMTKEEIKEVCDNVDIETEVFVHGAHCMSVSGQCTMSSMIGGRSGNRGACAQPCRLPFTRENEDEFNLSLKDLSIIPYIKELEEMGVTSAKIEGRMKRPEYVAAAVTACVSAKNSSKTFHKDYDTLKKVFSRSGFTDGFYTNHIGKNMFGTRQKTDTKFTDKVLPEIAATYRNECPLMPVKMTYTQRIDRNITLTIERTNENGETYTSWAEGQVPEVAINKPLAREKIVANLRKLGSTPYFVNEDDITLDIDETLTVPISAINDLRRRAIEQLSETLLDSYKEHEINLQNITYPEKSGNATKTNFRARFISGRNIPFDMLDEFEAIFVPIKAAINFADKFDDKNKIIIEPPRAKFGLEKKIIEDIKKCKELGFKKLAITNIGDLKIAEELELEPHGTYALNITNSHAIKKYDEISLKSSELSFELDLNRANALTRPFPIGNIVYGHVPVMLTRNCPNKAVMPCDKCGGENSMVDRLGNEFKFTCGDYRTATEIYNCNKIYLADRLDEFTKYDFLTMFFTFESVDEVREVIEKYKTRSTDLPEVFTRGLSYRPII